MDILTIVFWIITLLGMGYSLLKKKAMTLGTMKQSKGMMQSMLGEIVGVIFIIGLLLAWIPPETIQKVLGSENVTVSTMIAALLGSITLIPAFVAFPLIGSLMDAGANVVPVVAFLTTLTMVGVVTFPIESSTFGTRFTLVRNGLSLGGALVIASIMGVIL
jgi:uncharacterized membrane protein YraQ (UPF0718 family)